MTSHTDAGRDRPLRDLAAHDVLFPQPPPHPIHPSSTATHPPERGSHRRPRPQTRRGLLCICEKVTEPSDSPVTMSSR